MIHPVHGSIPPVPAALIAAVLLLSISSFAAGQKNAPVAEVSGELKQWHKVTLTLAGPSAGETDRDPNPFLDYRLTVTFRHQSGSPVYRVPGYFAADGNAANSSATAGNKWKAHLSPDKTGRWDYRVDFVKGHLIAVESAAGQPIAPLHGLRGSLVIAASDKRGADLRAQGRLQYVGQRYLQFAGSKEYFLKIGPDAPENLLGYQDFDGTQSHKGRTARPGEATPGGTLKTWQPHVQDWHSGDPTWKDGKGKGLIGALNYLSSRGLNTFSFLTYNAGGDGDDVWPFAVREDKLHYDCSKLDQWGMVFDHATARGLHLHFKMQETEIDDNRRGEKREIADIPESLDQGKLGVERKLYCRELVARFSHNLALNWNIGEENTQSPEEQREMVRFLHDIDPYHHHIVIHTYPVEQDRVYRELLGSQSLLTGASLQNSWNQAHQRTLKWVNESTQTGRPWVVANDEQGPANLGVPPDPGFEGFDGKAVMRGSQVSYDLHSIRKATLWGTLMAGGAGVEYYFGYQLPQNDLVCDNWRSRERSWNYARIAVQLFRENRIPFWEMHSADPLIGNAQSDNSKYCLAQDGRLYLIYLPNGGTTEIDLKGVAGNFQILWFHPRQGGKLLSGSIRSITGGGPGAIGQPPAEPDQDWLAILRKN